LLDALPKIQANNAQGELYLTDIMALGYREKKQIGVRIGADSLQILGVNNCQDLEVVDAVMEKRDRIIS
jgi:bifunctional UDP-N-acetylglucosamine pyrophosphorylase/glucosamine-1-phosphate N-acetyltransferase